MKILFVDDEPNVLQGLQRMLRRYRNQWDMRFADSGQEALQIMASEPFDVIVSDVRMPSMDGVDLLTEVQACHPATVRVILSGHAGEGAALRAVGPAHQYLSKPCDAETLQATVQRALALRNILANASLKQLITRMSALPSLPSLYQEIMAELRSEEPSIRSVADIVARDVAMTAKVLQLVNSAFFGLQNHVTDTGQAVMHLGTETVRALALSTGVFSQLEGQGPDGFQIEALWDHSARIAAFAKRIAMAEQAPKDVVDASYQAGFLHDIGKLVLAANMSNDYAHILATSSDQGALPKVEREVLGTTHAEVGGYLLGLWGLPDLVVEAVTFHHCPAAFRNSGFSPLVAVHVADGMGYGELQSIRSRPGGWLDDEFLEVIGLGDRLEAWSDACQDLVEEE